MPTIKTELEFRLYRALRVIAKDYRSSESILRSGDAGLSGEETLEYAYDNLQDTAAMAIKGVRCPKSFKPS